MTVRDDAGGEKTPPLKRPSSRVESSRDDDDGYTTARDTKYRGGGCESGGTAASEPAEVLTSRRNRIVAKPVSADTEALVTTQLSTRATD